MHDDDGDDDGDDDDEDDDGDDDADDPMAGAVRLHRLHLKSNIRDPAPNMHDEPLRQLRRG